VGLGAVALGSGAGVAIPPGVAVRVAVASAVGSGTTATGVSVPPAAHLASKDEPMNISANMPSIFRILPIREESFRVIVSDCPGG
jgi:hypothetical protein